MHYNNNVTCYGVANHEVISAMLPCAKEEVLIILEFATLVMHNVCKCFKQLSSAFLPARLQFNFVEINEKHLMVKARIIDSYQRWEWNDTWAVKWQGEPWTLIWDENIPNVSQELGARGCQNPGGYWLYEKQSEPASEVIKSKRSADSLLHCLQIWAWTPEPGPKSCSIWTRNQRPSSSQLRQFHGFWENQLFFFSEKLPASLENTHQRDCSLCIWCLFFK